VPVVPAICRRVAATGTDDRLVRGNAHLPSGSQVPKAKPNFAQILAYLSDKEQDMINM
jgi:hypothetical protein